LEQTKVIGIINQLKIREKMKKVVRMLGLCALVALAFTACKKDNQKVTFTATVTQPTSNVRTHAIGYGHHLVWDAGDQIKVFNNAGADMDFALPTEITPNEKTVTFNVVGNEEVAFVSNLFTQPYYAFYPNALVDGDQVKMDIPAEQVYVPQRNFANNLYPMVGFNVDENDEYCDNFTFVSDAGFLNFSVTCPEILSGQVFIDEVVLRAKEETDFLNGTMVYDKDGTFVECIPGTSVITMTTGETAASLDWQMARDFTFVIPAGSLWSGFYIDVKYQGEVLKTFDGEAQSNTIEAMKYTVMNPVSVGNENQIVILP
jgi:hypothetical protein